MNSPTPVFATAFATVIKRSSNFHQHKIEVAQVWIKVIFYLIVLFGVMFSIMSNSAQAAPCFDNAQSAYKYLLAQETAQTQARDHSQVNINRASEGELVSLHGIGSSKAQAIVLYREMFGDFKTVDDLAKVKGIGAKTIEKNRSRLRVQ